MEDVKLYTCCFFGHRKITETDELKSNLYSEIEKLIINEKVNTFLFGSKSQFDDLCHTIVTCKCQVKMYNFGGLKCTISAGVYVSLIA